MNKELPLRVRLTRYMRNNHTQWFPSGHLQRLVVEHTKHTPRSCVRRLQEMHEDGVIERKLVHGHAYYRFIERVLHPVQLGAPANAESPHCAACAQNQANIQAFNNH